GVLEGLWRPGYQVARGVGKNLGVLVRANGLLTTAALFSRRSIAGRTRSPPPISTAPANESSFMPRSSNSARLSANQLTTRFASCSIFAFLRSDITDSFL